MNRLSIFPILAILIAASIITSCHLGRSSADVLPDFPTDSIDVYAELVPNEPWIASCHTYGEDGIIGHNIQYRLATDSANIYVDCKINILELHPKITANLLSFVHYEMLNWGFINEGDTIPPFDIYNLSDRGIKQFDIVRNFFDWEADNFYTEVPYIMEDSGGFNLEVEIYPVFLDERYVTYKKYTYNYTGGTHGNHSVFLQTFNRQTGESVDLADFFDPSKLDKVRERVVLHMARNYPIYSSVKSVEAYLDTLTRWKGLTNPAVAFGFKDEKDLERITIENFPINDPGLHEAGLVFTYEKYHLTPGCDGCPTVLIPYDEIRDCLKEPFCNYHTDPSKVKGRKLDEEYCYIGEEHIDSLRSAWSPADDGGNWPREITDWYKYRHGNIKTHYSINKIVGTWCGYGHVNDPRHWLTITPDGRFIDKIEEATVPDKDGKMQYEYSRATQGSYEYDPKWNKLTLRNYDYMLLDKETLEAFVKTRHPEHKYLIVHSIVADTMYVSDEIGDLWSYVRCSGKGECPLLP